VVIKFIEMEEPGPRGLELDKTTKEGEHTKRVVNPILPC
jgi:hypothetical protein